MSMQRLISTESVPPGDRLAYWMDFVCAQLMRLDCQTLADSPQNPFFGEMTWREMARLSAVRMRVRVDGAEIRRTPAHVACCQNEQYMLIVQESGQCRVRQHGREALLRPGDGVIHAATSPYALSFRGDFEQTVLVLPGDLLAPFVRDLDRGCACVLPREAPATRLLAQLAAIAAAVPEPLPPHIAAGVGHLIAETLVAALPGNERHGLTQYHVARAKETALARLGDPGLSPAKIAAVTGLSTAHLHRLFAACGEAVMAWVWARRLEACRRDLEDPCYDGLPVAAIGFRWGYKTDAHFSRAFKVRYGATPGEWRRKQREGGRR
ncbi:MAG: helix-turn-helix domain-containing protein [Steroidobacteraceae bacterium]